MARAKDPTQAELAEVFEYVDGELWRKEYVDVRNRKQGGFVKNIANDGKGYCRVKFKGRMVRYHRIIYILLKGSIPDGYDIDHKDGNPLNNDISNLIPKDNRGNQQNQRRHREGSLPGVYWHKRDGKWEAKIRVDGKRLHLGYFDSQLDSFDAYIQANRERNFPVGRLLKLRAEYVKRIA